MQLDSLHQAQQPSALVLCPLQQAVADRAQVHRQVLRFPVVDDLLARNLLHQLRRRPLRLIRRAHHRQQLLGEEGLAAAPVQHRIEGTCRIGHLAGQPLEQGSSLLALQAAEFYRMADVEGGAVVAADEVVRGGHPEETEAQALVGRVFAAAFVQRADHAEEAVGVELQAEQVVDFLHEDHDRRRDLRQQDLVDELREAVHRAQSLHAALLPPAAEGHRLRQAQIFDQPLERARIPLLFRGRGAAGLGIDHGTHHPLLPEPLHRAHPQAGFAHLPAVEHEAGVA